MTAAPLTAEMIADQQAAADRFDKAGLIPRPIVVRDTVRTSTPGA